MKGFWRWEIKFMYGIIDEKVYKIYLLFVYIIYM